MLSESSPWTTLSYHVTVGDIGVARAIMEQYPDIASASVDDQNLLNMALMRARKPTFEFERASEPASVVEMMELVRAHVAGDSSTWHRLLNPNEDNESTKRVWRPIDHALLKGNEAAALWLADCMENPWEQQQQMWHHMLNDATPLHYAAMNGMLKVCRRIVSDRPESMDEIVVVAGANVSVSAAVIAVMFGRIDVYRYLRGAMLRQRCMSSGLTIIPGTLNAGVLGDIKWHYGVDCDTSLQLQYMARCGLVPTDGFVKHSRIETLQTINYLNGLLDMSTVHCFLFGCRRSSGSTHLWKIGSQHSMGCIRRDICDYAFDVMLPHERHNVRQIVKITLNSANRRYNANVGDSDSETAQKKRRV